MGGILTTGTADAPENSFSGGVQNLTTTTRREANMKNKPIYATFYAPNGAHAGQGCINYPDQEKDGLTYRNVTETGTWTKEETKQKAQGVPCFDLSDITDVIMTVCGISDTPISQRISFLRARNAPEF